MVEGECDQVESLLEKCDKDLRGRGCSSPLTVGRDKGQGGEYYRAGCAPGIFFFYHSRACFCPPSPNHLQYLLAVSKNLARLWHPVYDDGKGGGRKWWE